MNRGYNIEGKFTLGTTSVTIDPRANPQSRPIVITVLHVVYLYVCPSERPNFQILVKQNIYQVRIVIATEGLCV